MAKRVKFSKKSLVKLYEKDRLTTFQIAKKIGCCQATVWKKLKQFKIKPRLPGSKRVNLHKKLLEKLYLKNKLSTWKIERKLRIPRSTIHRKLKEFKIPLRDLSTANIIYPKKDFSGNLIEKAYLIGFRLGDLGVRKIWPNSKTICVASGSTIKEQIKLIKSLFDPYCKVWIKKSKNGKINIQASLNESFNFLLSKEIPTGLFEDEDTFFAFLSGFIDAEGHIGIHNKMASFSLGNYDFKLLGLIRENLTKYDINCNKLIFDKRKDKKNNQGYVYRNNYCSLKIHKKDELIRLFNKIKKYLKHRKKVKALNIAIENINKRDIQNLNKMKNKNKFYVTTPIYYANAPPHLGGAYTTVAADILARWNRFKGKEVFFLTGTDEHGQKIQEMAEKSGKKPKEFVDEIVQKWKEAFKLLNISNDNFIRTTNPEHEKEVQKMLQELYDKNLIYKGHYESYYCIGCEQYLTKKDLVDGICPLHKRKPELRKEEAYLFRLSKFQNKLLELIKSGKYNILPKKRRKEVISFIEAGLEDISISRLKEKIYWGIPLPFDKNHCTWVWPDAFWNYISGLMEKNVFKKFWPVDVQLMAKDIFRVHATIWPALLLGMGYELPKTLFIHGYFTIKGQKMSKSLGNVLDPTEWVNKYGADSVRYFLMRNISFGDDGDVSEQALIQRHNDELANKLGNLVSRTLGIVGNKQIKKVKIDIDIQNVVRDVNELIENFELDKALNNIFAFIDTLNSFIQNNKLWETKDEKDIYELVSGIRLVAILLWPFIPETSEKIAKRFGFKISLKELEKPLETTKIKKGEILFKKI